ncbi:hypothetical protein ACLGL2_03935 [Parvimonas sp. G1641]|uniref:hypothetical protein n=1 Tax=Parvimonas sp. G1641 TaxID=3388846 RepID=UPI0039800428
MKSNSKNSEVKKCIFKKCKEKYRKILHNKVGLCVFIIITSILFEILFFRVFPLCIGYLIECFKPVNRHYIWIGYLMFYAIISITFLSYVYKIKNNNSKKETNYRFIVDLIFIIDVYITFYLFSIWINKFLILYIPDSVSLYIKKIIKMLFEIIEIHFCFYFLNSVWRNFIKISRFYLFALLFFMTLTGWLSIKGFLVVNLVVTLINHFLSDIKYLYGSLYFKINKNKKNLNFDYNLVNEKKTKEIIARNKLLVNLFVVILYIYLAFCEFFESILIYESNDNLYKKYNLYEYIVSRILLGEIRLGILLFIIMIIVGVIIIHTSYDNFKDFIYIKFMNVIKKFIYIKKDFYIRRPKSIETNIKTSIHINSRKKSHRLYKYKNIEFHNKKPNSN